MRKLVSFLSFFLIAIILTSINSKAMQPPYGESMPAYFIYPNQDTVIDVKKHEVDITVSSNQSATIKSTYQLKNSSDTEELLQFIFPNYINEVDVSINDQIIEAEIVPIFDVSEYIYGDTYYDGDNINFEAIVNDLKVTEHHFEFEGQVDVYHFNKGLTNLQIEFIEDSTLIVSKELYFNNGSIIEALEGDLYVIDVWKNTLFKVNDEIITPSQMDFEPALKEVIQLANLNQLNEESLDRFYHYITNNENFKLTDAMIDINNYYIKTEIPQY